VDPSKWNNDFFGSHPGKFEPIPVDKYSFLHEHNVAIIYGTDDPPSVNDWPEGCIYLKYTP
jgi:hypothetical protein